MTLINAGDPERLAQLRAESAALEEAMRAAVHDAKLLHKRAGVPMVVWRDGQIVWIPADQIRVDDPASVD